MQPLRSLLHFIHKRKFKNILQKEQAEKVLLEDSLQKKYIAETSPHGKIKVFIYQEGFDFHFTRFYRSTIKRDFNYYLVSQIQDAEVVVFINTVYPNLVSWQQKVILFFHEPQTYSHLYQSVIPRDFLGQPDITVISHLDPALFITGEFFELPGTSITHIQSIPHIHFHHMATENELAAISSNKTKLICSVVSGFNGVPGYDDRRIFIEQLSSVLPEFDLYGRYGKLIRNIKSYRGYSTVKFRTIANYKYSLVIENSKEDWYISEKIFDALMCGCMPIYYGTDKIFELIPHEWFVYLPDLSKKSIESIEEVINTDRHKLVSQNQAFISHRIDQTFSFYQCLQKTLRP